MKNVITQALEQIPVNAILNSFCSHIITQKPKENIAKEQKLLKPQDELKNADADNQLDTLIGRSSDCRTPVAHIRPSRKHVQKENFPNKCKKDKENIIESIYEP